MIANIIFLSLSLSLSLTQDGDLINVHWKEG